MTIAFDQDDEGSDDNDDNDFPRIVFLGGGE